MIFPLKYQQNKDNYIKKYKDKYTYLLPYVLSHDIVEIIDHVIYERHHRQNHSLMIKEIILKECFKLRFVRNYLPNFNYDCMWDAYYKFIILSEMNIKDLTSFLKLNMMLRVH